MVGMITALA